jgi:hypothetical protein
MRTGPFTPAHRPAIRVALVTAFILLLPLLAMQFTDEVVWSGADFAVAGALLFATGLAYELVSKKMDSAAYRFAIGVALGAALLLVWLNLAVGIIGKEDDAANLMYCGVLAVGILGSIVARLQAQGMALVLLATAFAQAVVAAIAVIGGLGSPWSGPAEILILNGLFIVLFVSSAWLFRRAARTNAGRAAI